MRPIMNPHAYLNSFINFEPRLHQTSAREFNLKRVSRLLKALGDPQTQLKIIHVAGTKGKGSVCSYISYILRAGGSRVGLYTSPHLHTLNERIRVLSPSKTKDSGDLTGTITDRDLAKVLTEVKPKIERFRNDKTLGELTFFEVLTATAIYYFAQSKVAVAVLETGLGGRLDATNAVDSIVDVITPISLDHTHLLGNTLAKIAGEKAAIIKSRETSVVIAPQPSQALRVIQSRCKKFKIAPVSVAKDLKCRPTVQTIAGQTFDITTPHHDYLRLRTVLSGAHQMFNAATAIAAVEALNDFGIKVSASAVKSGIAQTRWPGRFEVINQKPLTIIDGAHNMDSAQALVRTFKQLFPRKKAVVILGLSQDKDIKGFCGVIEAIADKIILTQAKHPRALDFSTMDIQSLFKKVTTAHCPDLSKAMMLAMIGCSEESVILITGSVFVAAQARDKGTHVSVEKSG